MLAKPAGPPLAPDTTAASETSLALLERARAGDRDALERLIARYLARLKRWASGRAPVWARHESDTDDFVQEAVLGTLANIDGFRPKHDGACSATFARPFSTASGIACDDAIISCRQGPGVDQIPTQAPSPLDTAIG